jgi:TM2 domain-containing membrane protein YozV
MAEEGKYNKLTAGLLALFLGGFGIHKFYLGETGSGIWYLIFCWTGIPEIIGFIEGIQYLVMSEEEFNRKYCHQYQYIEEHVVVHHVDDQPYSRPPAEVRNVAPSRRKQKVQAWLVARDGRNYQLNLGSTSIGRASDNDIRIMDPEISKHHAKVIESDGHFKLLDLGSTNGTWLNGKNVSSPILLRSDDEVRLGNSYTLQFVASQR